MFAEAGSGSGAAFRPDGRHDGEMTSAASVPARGATGRTRVLVVDDEQPLVQIIASYLDRDGFETRTAGDGAEAIALAREWDPAVVVLDLGLPQVDGIEVCRAVRTFSDCYIVMLTARVEEVDKLIGLSVGADDYLTKPFSPRELVARVRAMLRRPRHHTTYGSPAPQVSVFGSMSIDVSGREVHVEGVAVDLTRTEFDVLAALAARPHMVFSRAQIVEAVWGAGWVGDEHLVDVHIGHLRRKLGQPSSPAVFIRTVRGVGYRIGPGR